MTEMPEDDMILDLRALPACIGASLVGCALLVIIAMVFVRSVNAESAGDHWICQSAAIYSFSPGAMQAEWDGQTWRVRMAGDPSTLADDTWQHWTGNALELGIMYANPELGEQGPAYIDYLDTSNNLLWRFAFIDLIATTESGRYGHHHSCPQGPVVYRLSDHG